MNIENVLTVKVQEAVTSIYGVELPSVEFQPTRKDFDGDITIVIFPMLRFVKGNPVEIGNTLGNYLKKEVAAVSDINVIKGFLNIVLTDAYFQEAFLEIWKQKDFGSAVPGKKGAIMVEYSSLILTNHSI